VNKPEQTRPGACLWFHQRKQKLRNTVRGRLVSQSKSGINRVI